MKNLHHSFLSASCNKGERCLPKARQNVKAAGCLIRLKCSRSWFHQLLLHKISKMLVLLLDFETFRAWPFPPLDTYTTWRKSLALKWLVFCHPAVKFLLTVQYSDKLGTGFPILLEKPYRLINLSEKFRLK